ncbi:MULTISPECIES: extracellular solute-binding protein [unclassified Plantibacter]|jgi:putative aldouronate transport system substrate-binding protein|uniref:extracellular solute-binding protein n=1 Tax=unclassified Plantibacter TaxID=2624265 RepID=UPI003D33F2CF
MNPVTTGTVPAAFSRRGFLTASVGAAALGALALSGCAPTGGGAAGASAGPGGLVLPTYVPFNGPKPDLPGTEKGVNAAYIAFPAAASLVATVKGTPGDGDPITAMTQWWASAKPGMASNSYWKALNERLGGTFDVQLVPGPDYTAKFATTIAGGKLPDLFTIVPQPQLPRLLQSQAVDLTEYLSGDAVKAYPNIANQPTDAWNGAIHNGRIYSIPVSRGILPTVILFTRSDLLAEKGITPEVSSFDEFLELCVEINDPANGRWALANFPSDYLQQMLGIPNGWSEKNGKLTSAWEYEEQEAALDAGIRLIKAGVLHPDAFTNTAWKERFYNGQAYFARDSLSAWTPYYSQFATAYPEQADTFSITGLKTPGFESGVTPSAWRGPSMSVAAGIGKASKDRVETILRVVDYLAAPFGSTEELFLRRGVEGEHFTWKDGNPTFTDLGTAEQFQPTDLAAGPYVIYNTQYPEGVKGLHSFQEYLAEFAQFNPTNYLDSAAFHKSNGALTTQMTDTFNEIVQGRQPIGTWKDAVASWKSGGGNQMRTEFQAALAKRDK